MPFFTKNTYMDVNARIHLCMYIFITINLQVSKSMFTFVSSKKKTK